MNDHLAASAPADGVRHWAAQKERGSFVLMKFTALVARRLGRRALAPMLHVIVAYFFLSSARTRRAVREYQERLAAWAGRPALGPSTRRVFGQYMAFAECLLDRLDVWNGKLRLEQVELHDPHGVRERLLAGRHGGRGQILVCTHLGNLDVSRAMAELGEQVPLNVLVHNRHVARFNRLLGEAGEQRLRLIQVSELDAALMMDLSQRLERGEWLAIAGDRVPLHGERCVTADFLGHPAPFPQGPWLMAGLLRCPVNLICCIKVEGRYRIHLEPYVEHTAWPRGRRDEAIHAWVQGYADWLGQRCLEAPQQWFNFYPYWRMPDKGARDAR
jgi:predicted LPLAT superfamily acyltransferase